MISNQSKITSLAILRGIAVLAVCFCHFGKPLSHGPVLPDIFAWLGEYGQYGVHIFFVISGFVIPYSLYRAKYEINDYFRFLYKRFLRLHPPYLVGLAITLMLAAASYHSRHIPNPESVESIIKYLFYIQTPADNPVFWTLRIEAEYYIFIGLFFVLLLKWPQLTLIAGTAVLLALSQTVAIEYIGLLKFIVFFLIGTVGYLIYVKGEKPYLEMGVLLTLIVFSFAFYELPASIVSLLTIAVVLYFRRPVHNVLEFPGEISYSLYLIHFPVGIKMINLLQRHIAPANQWILFFAATIVCFGLAWLFWMFIEKPSAGLSNRVKYGKARAPQPVVETSVAS